MIRILLLLGFIFYSFPSLAKIVYAKGSFMHGEEISTRDGCKFAREKAELEALQKGLNVTISSEEIEKCSQIYAISPLSKVSILFSGLLNSLISWG